MFKRYISVLLVPLCLIALFLCGCSEGRPPEDSIVEDLYTRAKIIIEDHCSSETSMRASYMFSINVSNDTVQIDGNEYYVTDLDYDIVHDTFATVFAGEQLDSFLDAFYYNNDGCAYMIFVGGKSGVGTANVEAEYVGEKDGMYNYHINYCLDYSYDNEYGELVEDLVPCEDDISVVLTDDGYRIADGLTSLYSGQSSYWLN